MDSIKIPEILARDILKEYQGYNNQILFWKLQQEKSSKFKITRTQANYIIKYHTTVPKIVRRMVEISSSFGEKMAQDRGQIVPITQIWCEKLLCESDMAYHFYGKELESDKVLKVMWIPKMAILQKEKTLKEPIDYSKYHKRPPMEHQKVAIEKLLCNNRFILADDMGVGKTTSAVIASLEAKPKKVLVVCPASLKINWKREIEEYAPDKKILIVEGRKWGSTFDYYIINYDIIKNYHSVEDSDEDLKLLVNEKFDLALVDEAHYLSNPSANRTKLLNDVLDTIPKVWLLTGTPMTSRPINYFNLLKIIRSPLTLNWQTYVKRYCKGFQFKANGRKIWSTSGASNLDELRDLTKHHVLRRLKTDVLDLPDKIVTPIYLELGNKMYGEELDEFIRITKEQEKESLSVQLSRLMKIRQLIAVEKIPSTCELIDKVIEQGKKVIILTNFTSVVDMLHEKYKKNSVILDGRMSKTKKQESVDKFQTNDKINVFIGNIKAAGVGITLTAAEVVIMNDLSFVPSDHAQGEDRAYRYGQKKSVSIYYPIFENTIELIIYNMLQSKKNVIDQVMGEGEYSESFTKDILKEIL